MKIKAISSGVGLRDHQKTLSKVGCMTCYPMLHSCRRKHLQTIRHCCSTHLSERVTNGHVSISKISCHWWIWNRHSSHAACSPLYTHHHSPYQFLYSKTECKEMVSRIVDPLTTLKGVRKVGLCWVHLKLLFWKSLSGFFISPSSATNQPPQVLHIEYIESSAPIDIVKWRKSVTPNRPFHRVWVNDFQILESWKGKNQTQCRPFCVNQNTKHCQVRG